MEVLEDFLHKLGPDVSTIVLSFLDDPADFVRASSVSRSWRQFVIENEFCKKLCLKLFPEVSNVVHGIEVDNVIQLKSADSVKNAENNHNVYAFLARGLSPELRNDCISAALCASTTDNYPEESILNTLDSRDRIGEKGSYWSSAGRSDPSSPEKLTYGLVPDLCFITEINIQPFQAFFQYGFPIYSARAVRFRMGYPSEEEISDSLHNDRYKWAYESPVFPMAQENRLQKFKLPEPVLFIGGTLQIELLGRVQRQEMDNLFYICVAHVEVVGRRLVPSFRVNFTDCPGKCWVDYHSESTDAAVAQRSLQEDAGGSSQPETITANLMRGVGVGWERVFLNTLLGHVVLIDSDEDEDEDYSDEEMIGSP